MGNRAGFTHEMVFTDLQGVRVGYLRVEGGGGGGGLEEEEGERWRGEMIGRIFGTHSEKRFLVVFGG